MYKLNSAIPLHEKVLYYILLMQKNILLGKKMNSIKFMEMDSIIGEALTRIIRLERMYISIRAIMIFSHFIVECPSF